MEAFCLRCLLFFVFFFQCSHDSLPLFQVTQKVFELCGTPRLGRREAQTSQFVFEKRLEKIHRTPARPVKSEFELMLIELKKRLKSVEGFWSRLPYQMCDTQLERPFLNVKDRESCWNGKDVGLYEAKVLEDGLANQMQNPEVPVAPPTGAKAAGGSLISGTGTLVADLRQRLESLTGQLRSAFRGLDIEWWDREDGQQQGDEGSGGGGAAAGLDDDEDYSAGGGGSGEGGREGSGGGGGDYDSEILVPAWTKEKERTKGATHKFETDAGAAAGGGTNGGVSSGGASVVHLRSKSGLARAVLTYLLPVLTCYVGGLYGYIPVLFS
jgi:hypothetical protein